MGDAGRSVYGLRVFGLDRVAELPSLATADDTDLLPVRVRQSRRTPPAVVDAGPGGVDVVRTLTDGRTVALHRRDRTAIYYGSPLAEDELAHPYLGAAAVTFNRWARREVFHAGAFAQDGRAWLVLGGRTAGKSTLMAALAGAGVDVIADDLVVIDGTTVFTGPRSIDLREPIPAGVITGRLPPTHPSRSGTRTRISLPDVATRWPLGGWIFLVWDDEASLQTVPMSVLLARLATERRLPHFPSDPSGMLTLACHPGWVMRRPRTWTSLASTVEMLIRATQSVAAVAV